MTFVSELTYGLPHFTSVAAYAKVVKGHSLMRQGVRVAQKILLHFYRGVDEPETVLECAREHFAALDAECERAGGRRASLLTSFAEFMAAGFDDGEEIASHARRGTDETTAKPATNDDLVLEAMERSGLTQMSTAEVEKMLAGKMARSTVMNCLKRLADLGKIGCPRRGWWALLSVCPTCLTSIEGRTSCTNCGEPAKLPSLCDLHVGTAAHGNGNGFHKGVQADA